MTVKEWFYGKKIYCYIIAFILGCLVTVTIIQPINNRAIRHANRKIGELELRLNDATDTIRECEKSVGKIAESIGTDTTELTNIIQNLRVIRDEVFYMENSINQFSSCNSNRDNSIDSQLE